MLSTRAITKSYENLSILRGVSMEVKRGEMVGIVGASGAGKSTFMHIMGTLDKPDSGKVFLDGVDVFKLSSRKLSAFRNKNIGFIFQFHYLLPEFSAIENICIPAWIAGLSKKEATMKAESLLEKINLKDRAHHKPSELSGGEQQRVAIARALINNPAIVLADEPTGNLDSENSMAIFHWLQSLKNELQQTFIMVTHNEALASLCDRTYTMVDGLMKE